MAAAEVAFAGGEKGVRTANFAVLIHRGIKKPAAQALRLIFPASYLPQSDNVIRRRAYSVLMNPLMILVKIIKLRWIHILSYDQMVSRKIN
ncbi:hypothetical protein, partial [Klebsiella pneumoniae]|uniref:hypothetical protein n=1 Tax=Klebsiella pneumoniae TaxID=573 RepID=UPI001C6E738E